MLFKKLSLLLIFTFSFLYFAIAGVIDYYQLKTYKIENKAQEDAVDNFLQNAYLPAMHKAGIKFVGVFKPLATDAMAGKAIYVWTAYTSLDHFAITLEKLQNDEVFQNAGISFLGAPFNQKPFERIESTIMKAFADAPNYFIPEYKTKKSERIYELRSYEGPTENLYRKKVEMFNEGGEIILFKKLDFNAVFYAEVISGSTMPNLVYMTTFADKNTHEKRWAEFRAHPEWIRLSAMQEFKNTVSKSVKTLLYPTEYSDF